MDFKLNNVYQAGASELTNQYYTKLYTWLFGGIGLTALVSYYIGMYSPLANVIYGIPFIGIGLIAVQFGLVIFLVSMLKRVSYPVATGLFLFYCAFSGVTLSYIFLLYTAASIVGALISTSALYAGLAFIGYTTKVDMTKYAPFLFAGVFALIIAGIVNMFLGLDGLSFLISIGGVAVFTGLTIYDFQKMKQYEQHYDGSPDANKYVLLGAFSLYLDFINLFIYILRLMGERK